MVVGDVDHRSCIGDSGGPALVDQDGTETIVGVDSYSELSGCLVPAHYRRPDVHREFPADYLPAPPVPDAGAGGSGGDGGAGGCDSCAPPAAVTEEGDDGGRAFRASGVGADQPWRFGAFGAAMLVVACRRRSAGASHGRVARSASW